MLLGQLNSIRRAHPALQQLRRIDFHPTNNDGILAFSKVDGDDRILCIVSVDQDNTLEGEVMVDMAALGLQDDAPLHVRDELTGATFTWGQRNFVRLAPAQPAHILHVL